MVNPSLPFNSAKASSQYRQSPSTNGINESMEPSQETNEELLSRVMESVIKIFVTTSPLNYELPWQNKPLTESLGSGFIIEGRRIMTNAHVVADAMQVCCKKI